MVEASQQIAPPSECPTTSGRVSERAEPGDRGGLCGELASPPAAQVE
jgi:hypothetical protein